MAFDLENFDPIDWQIDRLWVQLIAHSHLFQAQSGSLRGILCEGLIVFSTEVIFILIEYRGLLLFSSLSCRFDTL